MTRLSIGIAASLAFVLVGVVSQGAPDGVANKDEAAQRRQIERSLGATVPGHFVVAMWEVTSAEGEPVNLTAQVKIFEGREAAVNGVAEHLQGDVSIKRGFRLINRFNPNPIDKEFAETVGAAFEKCLKSMSTNPGLQLPRSIGCVVGSRGPGGSDEMAAGPKGVRISLVRFRPRTNKPAIFILQMP